MTDWITKDVVLKNVSGFFFFLVYKVEVNGHQKKKKKLVIEV